MGYGGSIGDSNLVIVCDNFTNIVVSSCAIVVCIAHYFSVVSCDLIGAACARNSI